MNRLAAWHDDFIKNGTDKILTAIGRAQTEDGTRSSGLFRMIEDPYLPEPLKSLSKSIYERTWAEIQDELIDEIVASFGWDDLYLASRDSRLEHWPERPKLFKCCQPGYTMCSAFVHFLRVLRARFLYADQPADGSAWKVLRDPLGLLIFLLKMNVTTSVATFALLFVLMDRRDEAQLVNFILRFKTTMFITAGLVPAAFLGMGVHACLTAVDAGMPELCIEHAPSSSAYFPLSFASELLRLGLIGVAFSLLACGHAVGGAAEVAALEYARLDAHRSNASVPKPAAPAPNAETATDPADEQPTGWYATAGSCLTSAPSSSTPVDALDARPSPRVQDPAEVSRALEEQRAKWGAERRVGGALPYFLAYDVLVLCTLITAWYIFYVRSSDSVSVSSPLFWSSLYYLKMIYGLLSFPFLLFEVPIIGPALTKCRATAYDQTGRLVAKLGKPDVATLYELHEASREGPGGSGASSQAQGSTLNA